MYPTLLDTVTTRAAARFRVVEQIGAVLFVTILTAIAAQISIPLPFTPVPFTFQPMVVLLGAAALGPRLGMASQILYLAIGFAGLPVFAASPLLPQGAAAALGPRLGMASQILYLAIGFAGLPVFAASPLLPQGAARLLGPTGGYLMAYPFAAFAAGWLAARGFDRRYLTAVVSMACGLAIVFAGGVLWLTVASKPSIGLSGALAAGFVPFIIPDLLKLLVAAGVMPALWRITGSASR